MRKRTFGNLLVCLSLCLILLSGQTEVYSGSVKILRITEISLRRLATKTVMPDFPRDSRKRGAKGVSVAELNVDEHGQVLDATVIEAPDDSIKAAVADAVRQWRFRPSTIGGEPVRVRGKLTFYYVNDGGKARVENPRSSE